MLLLEYIVLWPIANQLFFVQHPTTHIKRLNMVNRIKKAGTKNHDALAVEERSTSEERAVRKAMTVIGGSIGAYTGWSHAFMKKFCDPKGVDNPNKGSFILAERSIIQNLVRNRPFMGTLGGIIGAASTFTFFTMPKKFEISKHTDEIHKKLISIHNNKPK